MNKTATSLATLVSVFFFWGFVAASNGILIPVFKAKLNLEQWQSQMIAFAFYVAYTVGSLGYLGLSKLAGTDLIGRWGYARALSYGLIISALGTLLFIPAAESASFPLLLSGLIVVGLGFSLQQTVANPLAIALGTPETGSMRLSLAGGVNNVGTTVGPLLVSYAIFGNAASSAGTALDITAVKIPYLALGALFILFALVFWNMDLGRPHAESAAESASEEGRKSAFSYPQVWMGMIAIFLYVGVEVATADNLPEYLKQYHGVTLDGIAPYISLYWASLMIGRWTSSSGALGLAGLQRQLARWALPALAFGLFFLVNHLGGHDPARFVPYLGAVALLVLVDWATNGNPAKQLLIYSALGAGALCVGMLADGPLAVYAFLSVGLFCSTLWPCIFTLSIAGMGSKTSQASNALIMMIMGGGVVSLAQGALAHEDYLGIRYSFLLGVLCFGYLAFYAWKVGNELRRRGVSLDGSAAGGH
jgi:FHS family L-fucose permease-like MFS transporter